MSFFFPTPFFSFFHVHYKVPFFFKREASTTMQPVVSKKKKTLTKSLKNKDTSFFKPCKLTGQKKKKVMVTFLFLSRLRKRLTNCCTLHSPSLIFFFILC